MTYEDILGRAASTGIAELFKRTLDAITPPLGKAIETVRAYDVMGSAAVKYSQTMVDRYGSMRIFGMQQPVSIVDIYTQVNVLEDISAERKMTVEDLNRELDREYRAEFTHYGQRRFGMIRDTRAAIDAFAEFDRLVLLGKPGSGKTTFLKHVMLAILNNTIESTRIPVMVSLNQAAEIDTGIIGIVEREFSLCGIHQYGEFVGQSLRDGRFAILLDGLDEVREERRSSILSQITNLTDQYPGNKFVVTCRVAAYSYWLERFTNMEIADFNADQVSKFVDLWYKGDPRTGALFMTSMGENQSLAELSKTPLLLTIMCLAYSDSLSISENRAELYRDAVEALLKKWDASRSIKRDEIYKELTLKRKEDLFAYLAAQTFPRNEFFLRRSVWGTYIFKFLQNLSGSSSSEEMISPGDIVDAIAGQHGILVERASGIYSFSHLTFLEYFMAQYAVNAGTEYQIELINTCVGADQWREVIILLCCLVNDADQLLIALMEAAISKGFVGRPLEELRSKQRLLARATPSKFVLNPPDAEFDVRSVLSVVGKVDGPSIKQVESAVAVLSNSLLPGARKAIRQIAWREAEHCLQELFNSENHRKINILYLTKKQVETLTKSATATHGLERDKRRLERVIAMEFESSCYQKTREGLMLVGEGAPDGEMIKLVKGRARRSRIHPVWGVQRAPDDLPAVRLAVVGAMTNQFKLHLGSRAFGLKKDYFQKLEQRLLDAVDLNNLPEIQAGMQRLYIFDLIYDVLKQPIVARPEVRRAVMRTLLENELPDPGPDADGMRLRA